MKKNLLKMALAGFALLTAGSAYAAVGDTETIVNQTFAEGTTLTSTDEYTWGSDIQGMQENFTEPKDNKTKDGLLLSNKGNATNNFENRDFLTFTTPVGGNTQEVTISYDLWSYKDFQKPSTTFTIAYYNADENLIFSIEQLKGVDWGFESYINYNTEGGVQRQKLESNGLTKNSQVKISYTIQFAGEKCIITTGGASYSCITSVAGIKNVKISYTGAADNDGRGFSLLNYVVKTTEVEAAVPANYSLKYVCGETILKTESKTGFAGDEIAISAAESADFTEGDVKYIYVSNDAAGKTIAADGSTVVTLTYRAAAKYAYTVKSSNPETTIAAGEDFEGNSVKVFYKKYLLKEDNSLSTKNANSNEYSQTITLTENNQEFIWEYSNANINDVVYLAEAEDIEGMTSSANNSNRTSNGLGAFCGVDVTATTLEPGKYTLTASVRTQGKDKTFKFYKENTTAEENLLLTITSTGGNTFGGTSEEFAIYEETPIIIAACGDSKNLVDYIYIQKTGDVITEAPVVKVGDTELTTAEGSIAPGKITFEVPAGYSLYYKLTEAPAEPAEEDTPAAQADEDNDGYVEYTAGTEIELKDKDTLSYYLQNAAGDKSKTYTLVGDVKSGIAEIATEVAGDSKWYNLQGIQVAEPTQNGIYIHNGKKVLVKK